MAARTWAHKASLQRVLWCTVVNSSLRRDLRRRKSKEAFMVCIRTKKDCIDKSMNWISWHEIAWTETSVTHALRVDEKQQVAQQTDFFLRGSVLPPLKRSLMPLTISHNWPARPVYIFENTIPLLIRSILSNQSVHEYYTLSWWFHGKISHSKPPDWPASSDCCKAP